MITIELSYFADKITRIFVAGHSGTAPRGQDIVCAGVSALTQSAVLGLGEHLGRDLDIKVSAGKLECSLKETPDSLTEAIFQTMLLGLKEIAKINPKGVRIIEHRR